MSAPRLLLLTVLTLLVAAAPAAAQVPTPTPTPTATPVVPPAATPVPTATPAPAPAAVPGKLQISTKGLYRVNGRRVGLKRGITEVRGRLKPPLAGQHIRIRLFHGHKRVKTRHATTGADGRFTLKLKLAQSGHLSVHGLHKASPQITRAQATAIHILAFTPSLSFGSSGPLVRLFQDGLARMKYPAPRSGYYDAATGRAVMAYRKVNDLTRLETPSDSIIRNVLRGKGGYRVVHPRAGHHVEADISRQILALVDGDQVIRIEPVSSGKPSTPTVMGTYHFYSKTPGTNSEGMVDANYFIRGYAIHGYADVPSYNASHGCLRIPIPDARSVYDWINLGDTIFVEP